MRSVQALDPVQHLIDLQEQRVSTGVSGEVAIVSVLREVTSEAQVSARAGLRAEAH
ncbi:hypothetical protein [Cyanobium sp. CH-040]|uniref:hypothetical protein n=1 Tax=Cyanobium sp. CH-040 TaxID=2823708 RepID=UPI0020CE49F1|nr:hypothetical protein [Cyanobium sp. CH-040]MCP9928436.1 hypothetical protein [Cyanobium sp. CH-040]